MYTPLVNSAVIKRRRVVYNNTVPLCRDRKMRSGAVLDIKHVQHRHISQVTGKSWESRSVLSEIDVSRDALT